MKVRRKWQEDSLGVQAESSWNTSGSVGDKCWLVVLKAVDTHFVEFVWVTKVKEVPFVLVQLWRPESCKGLRWQSKCKHWKELKCQLRRQKLQHLRRRISDKSSWIVIWRVKDKSSRCVSGSALILPYMSGWNGWIETYLNCHLNKRRIKIWKSLIWHLGESSVRKSVGEVLLRASTRMYKKKRL